jgi:hypothetical protein
MTLIPTKLLLIFKRLNNIVCKIIRGSLKKNHIQESMQQQYIGFRTLVVAYLHHRRT